MKDFKIGIHSLEEKSIDSLLHEKTFEISFYQREYSWKMDHWTDFTDDLHAALDSDKGHFFGFMTFKDSDHADNEIIEGQQRITTVLIFLATVRDLCIEHGINGIKNRIQERYICNSDDWNGSIDLKPKIVLSRADKEFFRKFIQKEGTFKDKVEKFKLERALLSSNELIFQCYKYFYKYLSDDIEGLPYQDKENRLRQYTTSLLKKFIVVVTRVDNQLVAYNIFQMINDRGEDLTTSDLFKIHLCNVVNNEQEFIETYWDDVRSRIISGKINKYLWHFWLSTYGAVSEPKLLGELLQNITDHNQAFKYLEQLGDEVDAYEALLNPISENWSVKDEEIASLLSDLKIISPIIPIPLLMAANKHLKPVEFKKVIQLCINFIFRYLTIGERESKELLTLFSEMAVNIRNKKINNSEDVRSLLLKKDIDEEELYAILVNKDIKMTSIAKYIFKKIEIHLEPNWEKFNKKLTLEHILPQKPDSEWKEYMQEHNMEHELLVNKLGNLTLLHGKINSKIKNKFFTKKRENYEKSSRLRINEKLSSLDSWNKNDIESRQEQLSKYSLEIWKL